MALMTAIAATAVAVAGVSVYNQNRYARSAARAQREANEFQQKQANLQQARAKRDAVRSARLSYGAAQNAAANQGVMASSSSEGGLSSITSQAVDNVSFLDQYGFLSDQAGRALGRASKQSANAGTWGAIGGLAMNVAANSGSIAGAFKGPTPPTPTTGG